MDKITFCIPSKNNLRYLKTCIPSIRRNSYRDDHDIIIFVDSDNDGTIEWLKQVKDQYNLIYFINPHLGKTLFGIGKAYDYCIENSKTDICMIFHADMMLGKNADLEAFKHLKSKTVVCSTRIEPPLHPNDGEKILMDFGVWPEEFKGDEFDIFVEQSKQTYNNKTTIGIFAPWMINKQDILSLGGHDPIMHSAREDSDLFNRMKLAGYTFIQSWESLVYHLTGRGGQFQHGSVDQSKSEEWQKLMMNSTKEFIRKWGSVVKHTPLMDPIISEKYNIAFIVKNCNYNILETLEPWCDVMYTDDEMGVLEAMYYENEHKNTTIDLKSKFKHFKYNTPKEDIIVEFDGTQLTNNSFNILQQLPDIITESGEVGTFELDIFKITIHKIESLTNNLIFISNN
jgi:glycosyltransferase involved in cell wall biosynthesis